MVSWCGDELKDLFLQLFADADFAGCTRTQRSTTGLIIALVGPNTKFMQSGISKRQSAVSHCTTEAEMIAASTGFRTEGIPFQILWDILRETTTPEGAIHPKQALPPIRLELQEDNQAMIKICYNQNWQKNYVIYHERIASMALSLTNAFTSLTMRSPSQGAKRMTCLPTLVQNDLQMDANGINSSTSTTLWTVGPFGNPLPSTNISMPLRRLVFQHRAGSSPRCMGRTLHYAEGTHRNGVMSLKIRKMHIFLMTTTCFVARHQCAPPPKRARIPLVLAPKSDKQRKSKITIMC